MWVRMEQPCLQKLHQPTKMSGLSAMQGTSYHRAEMYIQACGSQTSRGSELAASAKLLSPNPSAKLYTFRCMPMSADADGDL